LQVGWVDGIEKKATHTFCNVSNVFSASFTKIKEVVYFHRELRILEPKLIRFPIGHHKFLAHGDSILINRSPLARNSINYFILIFGELNELL
jgi:hypothetical protein